MATEHQVKQGLNIRLTGRPPAEIAEAADPEIVSVFPASDWTGVKQKLLVKEGDTVKRGTGLVKNKAREHAVICSPAAGTVETIVFGPRRIIEEVRIRRSGDEAVAFTNWTADSVLQASREDLVEHLENTGYLQLFQQRPFSRTADATVEPKSIFVNGMRGAPFRVDPDTAVMGREAAFQAGLNALTRLTTGKVFLCIDPDAQTPGLTGAANVDVHSFRGPHPAGTVGLHIHERSAELLQSANQPSRVRRAPPVFLEQDHGRALACQLPNVVPPRGQDVLAPQDDDGAVEHAAHVGHREVGDGLWEGEVLRLCPARMRQEGKKEGRARIEQGFGEMKG